MGFRSWLTARIARFLTEPIGAYELRGRNDFKRLKHVIRKGDVLLVEGDQRVSAVIKYLTQSSWSHAVLYIGDELIRRGGALREQAIESFGDEAQHLVVEALFDGVVASPLSKYVDFNVRLCRPYRLRAGDLATILDDAIASIGLRYDLRNVVHLAFHLLLVSIFPGRYRREALRLGSGSTTRVICTSLLGHLFHKVRFPVLPSVKLQDDGANRGSRWSLAGVLRREQASYAGLFRRRHPTLLTPRDFDLSPFFEIVKFNVITDRSFNYQRIEWAEDSNGADT